MLRQLMPFLFAFLFLLLTSFLWFYPLENECVQLFQGEIPSPKTVALDQIEEESHFYDNRDGTKYRTTIIGGKRWFVDDLKYISKKSHFKSIDSCVRGNYYTHLEAGKVCPDGWSLPSIADFEAFIHAFGEIVQRKVKTKVHFRLKSMRVKGNLPYFVKENPLDMKADGRIDHGKKASKYMSDFWVKDAVVTLTHAHISAMNSTIHTHKKQVEENGKGVRLFKVKCVCELE